MIRQIFNINSAITECRLNLTKLALMRMSIVPCVIVITIPQSKDYCICD